MCGVDVPSDLGFPAREVLGSAIEGAGGEGRVIIYTVARVEGSGVGGGVDAEEA